jgi:cation diffusion facilitator CzcD-associated flavoprotein CzcO
MSDVDMTCCQLYLLKTPVVNYDRRDDRANTAQRSPMTLNARTNEVSSAKSHGSSDNGSAAARPGDAGEVRGHGASPTEVEVVIVGSGFSGIAMAAKLQKAGIASFVVLERGEDVGGTWRDNTYPGCACDVQSHLYSFSFMPNPSWSRMFAPQAEIQSYLRDSATKLGLMPHLRFGRHLESARYDDASATWTVRTSKGDVYRSRVLVSAIGGMSTPAYPKVKGLERFKGKTFHSARWDHDYDLNGKEVAVIGTGASAIQFVPQIAPKVARLDLYQRSAPWIMPKLDRPIGAIERAAYRYIPGLQALFRLAIYLMLELRVLGFKRPSVMRFLQRPALRYLNAQIRDEALREKLKPTFTFGCKRILLSNDYLPSLTRENVDVITDGIAEVTEDGVIDQNGQKRKVDAIIFGTGFEVQTLMPAGLIFGKNGVDLNHAWKDGISAYKGTCVTGFPNFFIVFGPNTGLGHTSMVYMIESQVMYVMDALARMRKEGWKSVTLKPGIEAAYNARVQDGSAQKNSVWLSGCKSWYLDARGRNTTLWPSYTFSFRKLVRTFDVAAYEIDRSPVTASPTGTASRELEVPALS